MVTAHRLRKLGNIWATWSTGTIPAVLWKRRIGTIVLLLHPERNLDALVDQ